MNRKMLVLVFSLLVPHLVVADNANEEGTGAVKLPLSDYNNLVDKARDPKEKPHPAPAGYALGQAKVSVNVSEDNKKITAQVGVELSINVLEDKWVLVPILPVGTPVNSATVSGKNVEFITTASDLAWGINKAGSYMINLRYDVDALRSENGFSLALPVPKAASMTLTGTLPGTGLDVAVIPSAGVHSTAANNVTQLTGTIPATSGVHISWRVPNQEGPSISRAHYTGELKGNAIVWTGEFTVELFHDETASLHLLQKSVTLNDLSVDGAKAAILSTGNFFSTLVKGRGAHKLVAVFEVPVVQSSGPPHIDLQIPAIPVSRFDLTLPGRKEVTVRPPSNVTNTVEKEKTTATVFVPITESISLSWTEAVPEEIKTEVRANASIYHLVHAEEGVLSVHAMAVYEVTRGETSLLEFQIPNSVQINKISAQSSAITDWRVTKGKPGELDVVTVFLDRKIKGEFPFDIYYDHSLVGENKTDDISVPLLKAKDTHRQRGMVALLASKELTLKPVSEKEVTRVGENQLPAFVRQGLEMTVAHTFKYVETSPELVVKTTAPEKKEGKSDAFVSTLISLSDVTMKGTATIEMNVKSGKISELQLELPKNVNFLSLTAPSLRSQKVSSKDEAQSIDVQFTQEMEGQFRLEVLYEFIMGDGKEEIVVPTVKVLGTEVEQGHIAVEALSAVEVQASAAEHLSYLDTSELPQQLLLRTTNPILMAYKYVHIDPPYKLGLRIARHKAIEVQSAAIDSATYRTLFTRDGLAFTTAQFIVRNSRKQFLRVQLPPGAKVWSAFVDGKAEKPAQGNEGKKDSLPSVLIKIINSTQGFPVDLIYQTPVSKIGFLGNIGGTLPTPDMVVTQSHWDVYLPEDLTYGHLSTNMNVLESGRWLNGQEMQTEMVGRAGAVEDKTLIEPLRMNIPAVGIRYSFEKLYANQSDELPMFELSYTSRQGAIITQIAALFGTMLFWLGVMKMAGARRQKGLGLIVIGIAMVGIAVGYFGISYVPVAIASLIMVLGGLVSHSKDRPRRGKPEEVTLPPEGGSSLV